MQKSTTHKLSKIYSEIYPVIQTKLFEYGIKIDSQDHLKLLYHYTLEYVFQVKRKNINTIFIQDTFQTNLSPNIDKKYKSFILNLHKLMNIPTTQNTHCDPIFTNILMNKFQKSTEKNKNFIKLERFAKKYGLFDIVNIYLQDPNFRYAIYS